MKTELYPLKFKPIIKEKIWGGEKLRNYLNKETDADDAGESWEISAVDGSVSVVAEGDLAGKSLLELIDEYQGELMGDRLYEEYGRKFPLLFKFIDANQNLSLQLHPHDDLALKRHDSFGKTEMWYIMQADENAGIYVGFKDGTDKEDYLKYLEAEKLQDIMNFEEVKTGDVYFIKTGLVHAIGEGVVLAEIQQSSDITYRVFDWNRRDSEGNQRELHTGLALDAIDFNFKDYHVNYHPEANKFQSLVENKYFKTRKMNLEGTVEKDYAGTDSFVVTMCVEGEMRIDSEKGSVHLKKGETAMLPASIKKVKFIGEGAEFLEVTV